MESNQEESLRNQLSVIANDEGTSKTKKTRVGSRMEMHGKQGLLLPRQT